MKTKHLKRGFIFLLNLVLFHVGYGQKIHPTIVDNQIKFSLSPVLYDNLSISHWGEKELLKSSPKFSGAASIKYYKHIKNNIGINIGVGFTVAPFNMHYNIDVPENSIFQTGTYQEKNEQLDLKYDKYISMWNIPLSVEKLIKRNEKQYYSIELGAKLNRVIDYDKEITVNDVYTIDETTEATLFDLKMVNKKTIFSYFIKAGLINIMSHKNTFQVNGVVHFSFTKLGTASYEFHHLNYESRGQLSQKVNYIGLELIYGISLFK